MQAVILCGGRGTRLKPLTDEIPKVMVDINGIPFLERLILLLKENGVDRILLCTGYLADRISTHLKDGSRLGVEISYSHEESPLDTGGALRNALNLLEDEFFVLNGDTYYPLDYEEMLSEFRAAKTKAMVAAYDNSEKIAGNNLRVEANIVTEYNKDSPDKMTHVDGGVIAMRKTIVEALPGGKLSLERAVYPVLISQRQLGAYTYPQRFYDMGTMENLELIRGVLK